LSKCLGAEVAFIKFCNQCPSDIEWFDAAVEKFSVHDLDYNPLCKSI
jgi:hypothetical protein